MTAILDAILDFLEAPGRFSRTFSMLFCWFFRTYSENVSLLWAMFVLYHIFI